MLDGSCLCGAIRYRADQLDGPIGHCHCQTCRKAHSAAYATTARVLREHFSWTQGEAMLRSFESSPGKLRHFCVQCGTHLMAEWIDKPNVILRLGSLDTDPGQVPVGHIWVSDDVPWMQDEEGLPRLQQGIGKGPQQGPHGRSVDMNSRDSTLRAATLADAEQVADIYLSSRKTFLGYAPLAHSDEAVHDWVRTHLVPSGNVTVAEADGSSSELLGMMALSRDAGIGWIDQLYLRPSFVGRGLGGRFVEHAKADLTSPIRLYTLQGNVRACRFYERHGFRALEYRDGSSNEENCPDVLFEWR